jgi:hypothetical protein
MEISSDSMPWQVWLPGMEAFRTIGELPTVFELRKDA